MKVALVSLHGPAGKLMPPLGSMYLSASLRQTEEIEVILFDEMVLPRSISSVVTAAEHIVALEPDVLCFTVMTEQHIIISELIHRCRTISDKRILIIVGGPHATLAPESCARTLGADMVCRGPGEGLLNRLLFSLPGDLELFRPPMGGNGIIGAPGETTINLNLSDFPPDRSCINLEEYQYPFTLMTARGCLGQCSFCSSPVMNSGRVSNRTIESIENEIGFLAGQLKARRLAILDDSFTQSAKRLMVLCEILAESGLVWFCESRLDCVDTQKLVIMREAGCNEIQFGVECFDQATLDRIGKNIRAESIPETLGQAADLGIKVAVSLMIGLPGDTVRSVRERIRVASRLAEIGVSVVEFGLFRPFPGTAIYEHSEELGFGDVTDWWEQDLEPPLCFPSSSMTRSELIGMAMYAKYTMQESFGSGLARHGGVSIPAGVDR